jgi:hypothetical protein
VTGRKLRIEELHNFYSSPSIIRMIKSRRMTWAGHVARMRDKSNAYRILVGKPEGKRSLERQRRRWVNDFKIDLREIGWDSMNWIDLDPDRDHWRALMNTLMNLRVSIECWEVLEWLHNWRLLYSDFYFFYTTDEKTKFLD